MTTKYEAMRKALEDRKSAMNFCPSCQKGRIDHCRCEKCADENILAALTMPEDDELESHNHSIALNRAIWLLSEAMGKTDGVHKLSVDIPEIVNEACKIIKQKNNSATPEDSSLVVPDGWRLVPVDPSREMLDAAHTDFRRDVEIDRILKTSYRAMLAAAPSYTPKEGNDEVSHAKSKKVCQSCGKNIEKGERYWWVDVGHSEHLNCAEHEPKETARESFK